MRPQQQEQLLTGLLYLKARAQAYYFVAADHTNAFPNQLVEKQFA